MDSRTRRIEIHTFRHGPAIKTLPIFAAVLIALTGGVSGQLQTPIPPSTSSFSNSYPESHSHLILPLPPSNLDPQLHGQTQSQSTHVHGNNYELAPTLASAQTQVQTVTLTPADKRIYLRRKPVGVEVPVLPIKQSVALFQGLAGHLVSFTQDLLEIVVGSIGLFLYVLYCIVTIPFQVVTNAFWGGEKEDRALLL